MNIIKRILSQDREYAQKINNYKVSDSIKGIALYFMYVSICVLAAFSRKGQWFPSSSFNVIFDIIMVILCIFMVLQSKNSLQTIGITTKGMRKSILLGGAIGIISATLNIVSSIYPGVNINHINQIMLLGIGFLIGAFTEELVFRGYIQTRVYGIVKNRFWAIIIVGIMFVLLHLPSKIIAGSLSNISIFWLINLFVFHIIFNFVYEKTGSIYGSVLCHWLGNISCHILI